MKWLIKSWWMKEMEIWFSPVLCLDSNTSVAQLNFRFFRGGGITTSAENVGGWSYQCVSLSQYVWGMSTWSRLSYVCCIYAISSESMPLQRKSQKAKISWSRVFWGNLCFRRRDWRQEANEFSRARHVIGQIREATQFVIFVFSGFRYFGWLGEYVDLHFRVQWSVCRIDGRFNKCYCIVLQWEKRPTVIMIDGDASRQCWHKHGQLRRNTTFRIRQIGQQAVRIVFETLRQRLLFRKIYTIVCGNCFPGSRCQFGVCHFRQGYDWLFFI